MSRRIQTLEDAASEIRTLRSRIDLLQSKNMDLHGRRVINAGQSQAPSDYVTKSELSGLSSNGTVTKERVAQTNITNIIGATTVIFTINNVLGIESNAAPQLILANDFKVVTAIALLKTAPLGANLDFRILQEDPNNLGTFIEFTSFTVLDGKDTTGIISDIGILNANQRTILDITAVGTTFPGERLTVFLRTS